MSVTSTEVKVAIITGLIFAFASLLASKVSNTIQRQKRKND